MISKLHLLFVIFLLLYAGHVNSQTYAYNDTDNNSVNSLENNLSGSFLLDQVLIQNRVVPIKDNTVVIQQVGSYNEATIKVRSQKGLINVNQLGSDNSVFIRAAAQTINESVYQIGDQNNFVDFSTTADIHNLELLQNGNGQNMIWYGSNAISEDIRINMQGENQSIIVRNFN